MEPEMESQFLKHSVLLVVQDRGYDVRLLTRAPLGYLSGRAPLGGGQILPPPSCLTHERTSVARWERRQTKALDEYVLCN